MVEAYIAAPLSPLRKVIAARMVEAKRNIPHFRLVAEIEVDALLAWRQQLNARVAENKISLNDCLIKACAAALIARPSINCQLVDDELRHFPHADIAVVVAIEGGLSTPVIRQADLKTVEEIAREVRILAARAAKGQLRMNEILGGSFSVSNLGGFGVEQFDAIINPPQCAILAVGQARPKLVVATEGRSRVATVMKVTLSVDHRAIDGVTAAEFVTTLQQILEKPQIALKGPDL